LAVEKKSEAVKTDGRGIAILLTSAAKPESAAPNRSAEALRHPKSESLRI